MKKFSRYKDNLSYDHQFIYSYKTKVAKINGSELIKLNWEFDGKKSTPTTSKHINYAAQELNLTLKKEQ